MKDVIFSNYNMETYEEYAEECFKANGEEYDEADVMERAHAFMEMDLESLIFDLSNFFEGFDISIHGSIERWNGSANGYNVGEFETVFYEFVRDCTYIEFYTEDGRSYIRASHHDGTNYGEISIYNEDEDGNPIFKPVDIEQAIEY